MPTPTVHPARTVRAVGSTRMRRPAVALGAALLATLLAGACSEPVVPDYNNPSESDFESFSSRAQVQNMVVGLIAGDRGNNSNAVLYGETLGRNGYRLDGAEPRYVTGLLASEIETSNFIGTSLWPYASIHQADVTVKAARAADDVLLSAPERSGVVGFAQTMKALLYLRAIESRDTLGIPFGTDLPIGELAPIRCKPAVLDGIAALLDSAATELAVAGPSFPFALPGGFAGFSTPSTFLQFTRALAAKVDMYRGFRDYAANGTVDDVALDSALVAVNESFLALDEAQLDRGPAHVYTTSSGDALNPLYQDTAKTIFRVNPRVRAEADPGDRRVAEKTALSSTKSLSGTTITSNIIFTVYPSNVAPIPILTNKELILLRAEILWGLDRDPEALADANFIREHDGGLAPVSISDHDALLTEILKQKRYSLLWESGARWIDARLFGRLTGEPPQGLGQENGFDPVPVFPIPANEVGGRGGNMTCTP